MSRIIVGCEESQVICIEFRKLGHEAFSCDLKDCSGGHPEWHIKDDILNHLNDDWDLGIFHPECTRLTNSVWWYIVKNKLYHEVKEAAEFFMKLYNSSIPKIVMENPIQNKEAKKYIPKQSQIIQPYNFGENASKATCLWIKNLPLLQNTEYFEPRIVNGKNRWGNQTDGGWNKLPPSFNRSELRAKTYPGIAKAMAEQWGKLL
jgi:hypothetical protein